MSRPPLQVPIALMFGAALAAPTMAFAQGTLGQDGLTRGAACVTPSILTDAPRKPAPGVPFDKRISFGAVDLSLPDALDRLAAAGKFRLSYSRELLPEKRVACLVATSATIGELLAHLLRGSDLEPVAAGSSHVVLRRRATLPAVAGTTRNDSATRVQEVASVIVTAGIDDAEYSRGAGSVTSIDGDELINRDGRSLREMLEGQVPGLWVWEQPPSSFLTQYGSLRGASSFGASPPKLYIDGIEVANPLLVTMLDPEHVARIEFIRGPQGAALYGADASSGVVMITTRHEGATDGRLDLRVRSSGGIVESRFSSSPLMAQNHSVTLRAGSGPRSFALAIAGDQSGSYLPGSRARQINALATGRRVGSNATFGLTARLATANTASPSQSFLAVADPIADPRNTSIIRSSLRQYTLGFTTEVMPVGRWRHTFVAGIDGYRLSENGAMSDTVAATPESIAIPAGADRASFRASSITHFGEGSGALTTLTFGAEHAALWQTSELASDPRSALRTDWRSNTGLSTQLDVALHRILFLSGGLRLERLASNATEPHVVALPIFGAGMVGTHDDLTLTLRGAYGKGTRVPRVDQRDLPGRRGSSLGIRRDGLVPEEQRGTEGSVKLAWGRMLSLQLTRFDQLASGLAQRVSIAGRDGYPDVIRFQDVGEIVNRGWEIEQSFDLHSLSLSSTLSLVDSRVRAVAPGYEGELRAGDRMLEVPALTAGMNLGYSFSLASVSIGLSHARDWIGYDALALRADSAVSGAGLRDYWRTYMGVTSLRASISKELTRNLRLVMTGDNLLDVQRGAPDNATVLPGRTTTFSLRASF